MYVDFIDIFNTIAMTLVLFSSFFFEVLRKCIYNFSQRISLSSNSAWHPLFIHPSDNGGDQYYFNHYYFLNCDIFIY